MRAFFLAISLFLGFFGGCKVAQIRHEPSQALVAANNFLRAFYWNQDYDKALQLADPQLRDTTSTNDLRNMVTMIKKDHGTLQTLRAESYLMIPGHNIG